MTIKADKLATTIISYLESVGQLSALPKVVEALTHSDQYHQAQNHVTVTSAAKLGSRELKQIETYIKGQVGEGYTLESLVDTGLIAGFTLQINDTFIDASFLGKINTVQNTLQAKD